MEWLEGGILDKKLISPEFEFMVIGTIAIVHEWKHVYLQLGNIEDNWPMRLANFCCATFFVIVFYVVI